MEGDKPLSTYGADDGDRIVAEERDRILESPMFMRSPVLSRLLQFLVEHRLGGKRVAPKAYAIATEALGRSADFDPAVDSYPRVMVGRLRNLLDRYYADTAWEHRLQLPQGSYEIIVQSRVAPPAAATVTSSDDASPSPLPVANPAQTEQPPAASDGDAMASTQPAKFWSLAKPTTISDSARDGWYGAIVVVLLVLAVFAGWSLARSQDPVSGDGLVTAPLVEISFPSAGETGPSRALARALDSKLRDGFRRFDMVRLLSAKGKGTKASTFKADFRLDSTLVRTIAGPVDVTLVLNRVADERAVWSQQIRIAHDDIPELNAMEPAIAQVAGDYGIIVQNQLQRRPKSFKPGFPCLAQFNRLRQLRTPSDIHPVRQCLYASLERDPGDPVLLSALALVRFGEWQPQKNEAGGRAAFAEALELSQRAFEAGPNGSAGLFAAARANYFSGKCSQGEMFARAAIERNPYDADIAGYYGIFALACGDRVTGENMLRRSITLDGTHAGVAVASLAFVLSERGQNDEALEVLNRTPSPGKMEPQYILVRAIVMARKGNLPAARKLWSNVLAFTNQPADAAPETVLRQFMITPTVITRASNAVRETGIATGTAAD